MNLKKTIKYISTPSIIIVVLIVFLLVLMFLQAVVPEIVREFTPRKTLAEKILILPDKPELTEQHRQQEKITDTSKMFLSDGTIHLVHTIYPPGQRRNFKRKEIYDADNNLIWSGKEKETSPYTYLFFAGYESGNINERIRSYQTIGPAFSRMLVVPVVSGDSQITGRWRYDFNNKMFTGFDSEGRITGYAGSDGIKESAAKIKPFEKCVNISAWCPKKSYSPILLWQTKNQLYQINFAEETIELLFESKDDEIASFALNNWRQLYESRPDYRPTIHIVTKAKKHYLLFRETNKVVEINVPKKFYFRSVHVAVTKDKIFLRYEGTENFPSEYDPKLVGEWLKEYRYKSYQQWVELYQVDSSGELNLINRFDWVRPARNTKIELRRDLYARTRDYATYLSPPVYVLAWRYYYKDFLYYKGKAGWFTDVITEILRHSTPAKREPNLALSLLMVCIMFWHQWSRRTSWAKFVFWLVFVGAFNLAGLLTYLALNHTTVIKCPVCGKRRGLAQVNCARCGVELPAPERGKLDLISNN